MRIGAGRPALTARRPGPVADLGRVLAVLVGVGAGEQPPVDHLLAQGRRALAQARHPVDDIDDQPEAVEVVAHGHVEGRRDRPLLLVAADVEVGVVARVDRSADG